MTNPFSTKFWTPGALPYVFDDGSAGLDEIVRRRDTLPIAQIVGPHGSGKSTLLESMAEYYHAQGTAVCRATLNDRRRELPEDFVAKNRRDDAVCLLDGYEQLSFRDRVRLRWGARKLVWTTHRPAKGVPVLHRTVPRFERFAETVRHLTEGSAIFFDDAFLRELFERSGANFRTAFFELYDHVSECFPKEDCA